MKTLIIGSSSCAVNSAKELLESGNEIIIALNRNEDPSAIGKFRAAGIDPALIMTDTKILSCRGCAGDFTILMEKGGENISKNISGIVIAEEYVKKPNFAAFGLKSAPGIISISSLSGNVTPVNIPFEKLPHAGQTVFLTGLGYESNPITAEEIMFASLKFQTDFNLQTYILTGNLKVAGNGLEKLYRETKTAGTVYFKFTNTSPRILQDNEGKIVIELIDEITQLNFRITPALTIVDETISPSGYLKELAVVFGLHTGADGFLQSGNLHRTGIYTNRKGVFVAGPSRSVLNTVDNTTDSANAAILTSRIGVAGEKELKPTAEIRSGSCVRCLTCYRCCPYRAIDLSIKPTVMPGACEGCGICFAECPSNAISMKFQDGRDFSDQIKDVGGVVAAKSSSPRIIAFCCSRSAFRAKKLALCMGHMLPVNLKVVEVPCSGFISKEYILSAFQNSAEGVLVLTCHAGNCHSEDGNIFVRHRVEQLKETFSQMNFDKERLEIKTLASNMGYEFAQLTDNFEKTLNKLSSSNLKKGKE